MDCRSNNGLHIVLANVSHQDIKYSLLVCWFGDYLAEGGVNVQEELDIEIILVASTDKGRIGMLGLQGEIVKADVFH